MRLVVLAAAAASALVVVTPTSADNPQLIGSVGPEYTISLKDPAGNVVTHVDPGTYTLLVHDLSDAHNFDLYGPGVSVTTGDLTFVGDKSFTVTFVDGTYTYLCDPHRGSMRGTFTAGNPPPPPPPPPPSGVGAQTISVRVGPGRTISFPRSLAAGKYAITVRDASAADNLHLKGPGVDRKTGIAFRGTVKWSLSLKAGTYRVGSDAHPSLAHSVTVG